MRKYLSIVCATMLCAFCLVLAACSGGAGNSSTAASSAAGTASSSAAPADPSEKFIGDWKLAGFKFQGLTATGDLSGFLGDEFEGTGLTVAKDGTGSLKFAGDNNDFKWTQKSDDAITLEFTGDVSSDGLKQTVDAVYKDEVIDITIENDGQTGSLLFSADGKLKGEKEISIDDAKAITSEDALVGTWKLAGVTMSGASVYGDADTLQTMAGDSVDASLTFEKDGKVKVFGEDATWSVGSDGASIGVDSQKMPVKALGDDIVLDLGAALGGAMDMTLVYSK